jgi:hypothetical protein
MDMVSLDFPEILIALGILAGLVWAGYNLSHHGASSSK